MSCALVTGCGGSKTPAAESEAATEAPAEEQESTDAPTEEQTSDEADAQEETEEKTAAELEDGTYTAEFDTDSSMFHVNEADEGRGILTVENGKMTIHISLVSKKIVNLFVGTADDAKKDGADILEPTTDTVKYSDGTTDEVYGFDVPVEALDEEFDLAILGTKGEWYDHKVSVSDPQETDN